MYKLPTDYTKLTGIQKYEVRCQYVELQDGKCWYCKGDLKEEPPEEVKKFVVHEKYFPNGFFKNPIHLQHDHVTRLTEGAVHAYCNAVLWEYHGR
jgi:hypothetical protein